MANISNALLYAAFVLVGVVAPTALSKLGPRYTIIIAISGYPIYTGRCPSSPCRGTINELTMEGAMWYFDSYGHLWYPAVAGIYLGCTAAFLWTTAAFFGNGYSEEKQRGFWRAMQWTSNVGGATVGGCIALGYVYLANPPLPLSANMSQD